MTNEATKLLREWVQSSDSIEAAENAGESKYAADRYCAALDAARAYLSQAPEAPRLTFTLREAKHLVDVFCDEDSMVTVRSLPEGVVKDDPADPVDEGPSPAGLWAHFTEYPEEGAIYLGPCEVDWRWCTTRGYEIGERCENATECAKNGCAKGRMLRAGICPDCNGSGCAACYAP